ncbi:MAG: HAMP domain-containing protein [Rhodoferax sp.]|nr:HAMP domain-containing protein [Rhodoferax sp.]
MILVFVTNLAVLGLLFAYGAINLLPYVPVDHEIHPRNYLPVVVVLSVLVPTMAAAVYLRPVFAWLRADGGVDEKVSPISAEMAHLSTSLPLVLALWSWLGWIATAVYVTARAISGALEIPDGHLLHFVSRPVMAGLIAATSTFFVAEHFCRSTIWLTTLKFITVTGNSRLRRVRVWHRLVALWLVVGGLPLGAIVLTTLALLGNADQAADPVTQRFASVLLLIAGSAIVGGIWLSWLVSRSITEPLEKLEQGTALLSSGDFNVRIPVRATDEFGSLTEGFNTAASRLSVSYAEIESRNRELATALERVELLEQVKRGLDRFVPDAVRRAIELNPEAPELTKRTKDVTVLFLDIEDYSRLSELLERHQLNALVESYFSLFLETIRDEGGDINETAGDGLMIIFQGSDVYSHAVSTVRAALAIQYQTMVANKKIVHNMPQIAINIGISSGECDVGATRFKGPTGERWTFTASGPVTNLAARLGDYAKGGQVLLSNESARRVEARFQLRSLGSANLKGLTRPEEIWVVVT